MGESREAYSFEQDLATLQSNVKQLEKERTPLSVDRCCERIRRVLDRIQEYKQRSYVPIEVKQYFGKVGQE